MEYNVLQREDATKLAQRTKREIQIRREVQYLKHFAGGPDWTRSHARQALPTFQDRTVRNLFVFEIMSD